MNLPELYTTFIRYARALSNGIDIPVANEWMLSITERKECWELCIHILCKRDDDEVIFFFASKLLHCIIRLKWEILNPSEQPKILEIILENIYGHNTDKVNNNTMNQLISCCAAIISRSYNLDSLQNIGNRLLLLTKSHKTAISRTLSIFHELTIEIKHYDSVASGNIYSQFSTWIIHLRHPIVLFISNCLLEHQQSAYSEFYLHLVSVALSVLSSWINTEYIYDETSNNDTQLYQDNAWLTLRHLVTTPVSIDSDVYEWTGLSTILNILQKLTKQFKNNSLNKNNQKQIPELIINIIQLLIDMLGAISSPKDDLLQYFNMEQLQENYPIVTGILQILITIIKLWEELIEDNINNISEKLFALANNELSMDKKKNILLEFQSHILFSQSSEDKNNINKILYGLVELTSIFAEKHLSILYGDSVLYQSARDAIIRNLSNNNNCTNIEYLLPSLLLLSTAIPDLSAALCSTEILIYATEMFPMEALQPFTMPLFQIITLQLMIPNDILPQNFLQCSFPTALSNYDNGSRYNKVVQNFISFEEEETINNSLMFRREVMEILVSLWLKWPGGKFIPTAFLQQLLSLLDSLDMIYANYQNTDEFQRIQSNIELPLEAMVFVFGKLIERIESIADDNLAIGTEEDSACNMASAILPGFSVARSALLTSTSQDIDASNGQILWFQVVGEITSYISSKNGEVSLLLLNQFCDLWTSASPSLRVLYDSKGSVFAMTCSSRNTLSSDIVLSSAVTICLRCLLISPEIASKSLREITVSLRAHLNCFAVDAVTNLLTILQRFQAAAGGAANLMSRVVTERVYSSLGRLVSAITPEEIKVHFLHYSIMMCTSPITGLTTIIGQTPPEFIARCLVDGWCEGVDEALSGLRGLILGLKEVSSTEDFASNLIKCVLELLQALDYIVSHESQILSKKIVLESRHLLDRTSSVLCSLLELRISVEDLQSTSTIVKSIAGRHATPGVAALATVVIRLGSEFPALNPELTLVAGSALISAVKILSQDSGKGVDAINSPHLEYILIIFRLLREVSRVSPQIFIQKLNTDYASRTTAIDSSDSNDSEPILHHAIHFIVNIIRNPDYLSNQKILRPLSAVMQSLLQIKLPGVHSFISTFIIEIIGPVLWGLLFGSMESMLTLSATLLWTMLEKHDLVTVEEHMNYLNSTLFTAFSQILTILPPEYVISITSNHSQHLELAANDVLEVVALSLVNFCTSRSSLKMSLMACMQLTRGQLGNVNSNAWLRWPDRINL